MNTIVFREWSILLCPRCEGSFYDETTLDKLLLQPDLRLSYLRPALLQNLSSPHLDEADRERLCCPTCGVTMNREEYSPNEARMVDRCPQGHGIWLDDGELGRLFNERELERPHPEPGFFEGLRRVIGMRPTGLDAGEPKNP